MDAFLDGRNAEDSVSMGLSDPDYEASEALLAPLKPRTTVIVAPSHAEDKEASDKRRLAVPLRHFDTRDGIFTD